MYFMLNGMRFRVHSGSDPFSGARSWIDMMIEAEEIKRARGQSCSLSSMGEEGAIRIEARRDV